MKEGDAKHWKTESSNSPRGVGIDKVGIKPLMTEGYDGIPEFKVEKEEDIDERHCVALTTSLEQSNCDYGSISTHKFLLQSRNSG